LLLLTDLSEYEDYRNHKPTLRYIKKSVIMIIDTKECEMDLFFKKCLCVLFILISFQVSSAEPELLKNSDVQKVMKEMLSQHVDKKEMTSPILQQSIQEYIDQFDPQRIYLLESEVNALNNNDQNQLLKKYNSSDFSIYLNIDKTIQKAIQRARANRKEILQNPTILFANVQEDAASKKWRESEVKRPFAKNEADLKKRLSSELAEFVNFERKRFGEESLSRNKEKTLLAIENQQKHHENQYLYQDDLGKNLGVPEQENLFNMHLLKALAKSLDSHSSFFSPVEAHDMKVRLEKDFKGIGIVLERKPAGVVISKLIKGGPAEKSGQVLVNDQVIKINGSNVENDSLEAVMEKLRDNDNPSISLTLKRVGKSGNSNDNKVVTVNITKENIQLNDERATSSFVPFDGGILGKITLTSFYQGDNGVTSEKDVRNALIDLKTHGELKGLILDLRENSGGFLIQAVKVAGLFITNGVVVISKYSNGEEKFYRDMDGKTMFQGPLIILTSRATASAAEIVAESIQDYGVGIVVGDDHTYGKGTIQTQTVTNNESHSFFKVTVGKYYTVSGKTPQIRGVKADILVPGRLEDKQVGEVFSENPLAFDTIKPAYTDTLSDIEPTLKPWYQRYYVPTLQAKKTTWQPYLENLRKSSSQRIANSKDYKSFLKEEGQWSLAAANEDNKKDDPQMLEAINILKEMVEFNSNTLQNVVSH
jgi:carboxyl-terminal processing protease